MVRLLGLVVGAAGAWIVARWVLPLTLPFLVGAVGAWLMEPVGSDPMYPKFGSKLWGMIGTPIVDDTEGTVKSEVRRVVSAYKSYQDYLRDQYSRSAVADSGAWRAQDVVKSVGAPRVSAVADTVRVVVNLRTEAGDDVTVDQTV